MGNPISSTILELPSPITTTKRQKLHHSTTDHHPRSTVEHHLHHHQSLLPGLPDDISRFILSRVSPSTLYSVSHSWRRLIYSPSFPPFLSLYTILLPTANLSNSIEFASFDPISSRWRPLPPPPPDPPLKFLLRHPSFISRNLPIQSAAVAGKLVLLAATDDNFLPALSNPLVFNPTTQKWTRGPELSKPRRWCAAGACGGAVYVASGIGSHYNTDVARSVEKWVLDQRRLRRRSRWEELGKLKDGKFSREAIDAVGWRGKLCMVNVKGDAAKEGIIYDVVGDTWQEMPEGMLNGWRGPAAAMEEESIYVVDESKGLLKKYDHVRDTWVEVLEDERFKGAQQLAAGGGRVCVLGGDGGGIVVVDVAAGRVWMVDAPVGFQVVGIHILPRLSHLDF